MIRARLNVSLVIGVVGDGALFVAVSGALLGAVLAARGAHVVVTEQPSALRNLGGNVRLNMVQDGMCWCTLRKRAGTGTGTGTGAGTKAGSEESGAGGDSSPSKRAKASDEREVFSPWPTGTQAMEKRPG